MIVSFSWIQALLFTGLASWMSVAVFNNSTDTGTNVELIGTMFSMRLLSEEPAMGSGLKWRAIAPAFARPVLYLVVVAEALVALVLWRAAVLAWCDVAAATSTTQTQAAGNLGLAAFIGLWFFFMVGGLWFAYWMKQGGVQQVHMNLLQIGILSAVLNNINSIHLR